MNNPWPLVKDGRYAEAVDAYTAALAKRVNGLDLRNRSTAYVLMARYEEAFNDIETAESLDPPRIGGGFHGDGGQIRLGVIEWLSGKHKEAGDRWLLIGEALAKNRVTYTDASGGLGTASILRFGAARLARSDLRAVADRLIKKLLKRPTYRSWPLPIGAIYADKISPEDLLASVSDTPILRERELCQAHFALAVRELERSNRQEYLRQMTIAASSSNAILEDEFFLGQYEIRRAEPL